MNIDDRPPIRFGQQGKGNPASSLLGPDTEFMVRKRESLFEACFLASEACWVELPSGAKVACGEEDWWEVIVTRDLPPAPKIRCECGWEGFFGELEDELYTGTGPFLHVCPSCRNAQAEDQYQVLAP